MPLSEHQKDIRISKAIYKSKPYSLRVHMLHEKISIMGQIEKMFGSWAIKKTKKHK